MRHEPRMWVVVGLGTNLGDRLAELRGARRALGELGELHAASTVYETLPMGPAQPEYLNAAVCLRTALSLPAVLSAALGIEAAHGRVRRERWGPRSLDLDLLWATESWRSDQLQVPHPRLMERAFALRPLLDVLPGEIERGPYEDALRVLGSQGSRVFAPSAGWLPLEP